MTPSHIYSLSLSLTFVNPSTAATQHPAWSLFESIVEQLVQSEKLKKEDFPVQSSSQQIQLNELDFRLKSAEEDLEEVFDELAQKKDVLLENRLDAVIYKMESRILELENKVRELEILLTNENNTPEEYEEAKWSDDSERIQPEVV